MADEEVEALQSIYGDELIIESNSAQNTSSIVLSMKIRPTTSNSHCAASIRAVIELANGYPKVSPKVQLRQPRGLNESNLSTLRENIKQYIEANVEMPVLFDVFQMIQEFLETEQSIPSAVCPICLNDFGVESDSVCTTNCDHYIHRQCFSNYIKYSKNEIEKELNEWPDDMKSKVDQILKCPMCRAALDPKDLQAVEQMPTDLVEVADEQKEIFEFNWEKWRAKLRELQSIYERQKAKGGLIDLDEERKRNLITDDFVFERQVVAGSSSHQNEEGRPVQSAEPPTKLCGQIPNHRNNKPKRPYPMTHRPNTGIRNYRNHFRGDPPKDRLRNGETQEKRGFTSRKVNNRTGSVEIRTSEGRLDV